jgi:signal transduction histidine kinase
MRGQMGLTKADGEACLGKPYRPEDVVRALKIVEQIVSTGEASQPFPKGFRVLNGSSKSDAVPKSANVELVKRQQAALARFGRLVLSESDLGKVLTESACVCAEGLDLGTGLSRTINFGAYLSSLCSSFEALQIADHPEVALTCHCEPVHLDLDSVTVLGLVISELIANSYAHAFPHGTGSISVSLSSDQSADNATIIFADDGVGFAEDSNTKRHGLQLVKRLMEQVSGSATLHSFHGSEWTLKFPVPIIP